MRSWWIWIIDTKIHHFVMVTITLIFICILNHDNYLQLYILQYYKYIKRIKHCSSRLTFKWIIVLKETNKDLKTNWYGDFFIAKRNNAYIVHTLPFKYYFILKYYFTNKYTLYSCILFTIMIEYELVITQFFFLRILSFRTGGEWQNTG